MCRHLAYLGPPEPVGDLLTRGPNSLVTQSWAPRDMRGGGAVNADGFGAAWWIPDPAAAGRRGGVPGPVPRVASRYRNPAPIWTDPAVSEVLPQLRSSSVMAAVRSATVGMPVERSACAPFTHGRWAFSHNGVVPAWTGVLSAVATEFGSPPLLDAESHTDSAALWVIVRALLGTLPETSAEDPPAATDSAGRVASAESATPATVLRDVVRAVLARVPGARLNLLLCDGSTIWATTCYHSLSVLVTGEYVLVSSEPFDDDPRWQAIGDRCVVTAAPGVLSVTDLDATSDLERPRP